MYKIAEIFWNTKPANFVGFVFLCISGEMCRLGIF